MRHYIRNEELYTTLNQILNQQNPKLTNIYKKVILYRSAINFKSKENVEDILLLPTRIFCSFMNLLLIPVLCQLLIHQVFPQILDWAAYSILASTAFLALVQVWIFFSALIKFSMYKTYFIVDELFARKILVVQQIQTKKAV